MKSTEEKYIDECKQIQQNCTYTAETHHQMATWYRGLTYSFQLVPAVIAAMTSSLTSAGFAYTWLPTLTTISAVVLAITTVLNPNKRYEEHLRSGRDFLALKHDARFLHEAESNGLSDEVFMERVRTLHEKYNDLTKSAPPTDACFFESARQVVQSGLHEPDRDATGNIK